MSATPGRATATGVRDGRRRWLPILSSAGLVAATVIAANLTAASGPAAAAGPAALTAPAAPAAPAELAAPAGLTAPAAGVTSPTVVIDQDFAKRTTIPDGWTPVVGDWAVQDGALRQTATGDTPMLTFGGHLNDFRFDATLTFDHAANAARWVALGLDVNPAGVKPWSQAAVRNETTAANGLELANMQPSGSWNVVSAHAAPTSVADGKLFHLAVEVHGTSATLTFDGQQIMTTKSLQRTADGVFGLIMNRATASFHRITVTELPAPPIVPIVQPGQPGLVVGHRGNPKVAPEDTLVSEVQANKLGADFMELDLDMTKDGVPVVMHDSTVNRTTNGTGAIRDLTLAQIKALDAGSKFDPAYAGITVPTFEEILAYAASSGGNVLPELKSGGNWTRADVQTVIDLVHRYGMTNRTAFQSFSADPLKLAGEIDPTIPRAFLGVPAGDVVEFMQQNNFQVLLPSAAAVTGNLVQQLHSAGIPLMAWTVDSPDEWARLTALGVDGIMSNTPGELMGWVERYRQQLAQGPVVTLRSPANGATVSGTVQVAIDLAGTQLTAYNLRIDNSGLDYAAKPATGPRTFPLDTTGLTNGAHDVLVTVSDAAGHKASVSARITVDN
ncbi:glycerophosphodiester phosphodiesterase [Nakamurella lactea]|uniref:glycerophosphodiester phosphodiesterase n=1 Tax=Nakamurella lactea TaxID=459515 RepID=UPI00042378E4|nr:glycerophosphodiester phosphodiesterase family protein [Nakamurella lactea]